MLFSLSKKGWISLRGKIILLLIGAILLSTQLSAEDWMQLYPEEIDRPVYDMEFSGIPGISEYGLILAFPGVGGGLGYFDNNGNFNIYSVATNLGAVSVSADNANNRIFCAFGSGSNSDGLYEFDVDSLQFELITWTEYPPHFVKKLSSGFYFGYGFWYMYGGLLYSPDGNDWTSIDYFSFKDVKDVAETSDGNLFVAEGNEICIENDTTFTSYDAGLPVNDIYVRHHPTEEVFIACGGGTDSDSVYKVEYDDGEITGITLINWLFYSNKIYEYENRLVVGCLNSERLWLVEPAEMREMHQISTGLDFQDAYCFETYPMYCHNIMVGTDNGIYLGTDLAPERIHDWPTPSSDIALYQNSPNPFSGSTTISFNIHRRDAEDAEIKIYNIKEQLVKQFKIQTSKFKINEVIWDGRDQNGNQLPSGIYFYRLDADNYKSEIKKMILVR
jgi:hypothetical protein